MNKSIIENLYYDIWNQGKFDDISNILSTAYTIHRDPGDSWEGKSLDLQEYKQRVLYSRNAFPDLEFKLFQIIYERGLFAVRSSAKGTHLGDFASGTWLPFYCLKSI